MLELTGSPEEPRYAPDVLSTEDLNGIIVALHGLLLTVGVEGPVLTGASEAWTSVALSVRTHRRRGMSVYQEEGRLILAHGGKRTEFPAGGVLSLAYFMLGVMA